MSIADAIEHIFWSLDHSPKSYDECREMLMRLQARLVNEEFKHLERKKNVARN